MNKLAMLVAALTLAACAKDLRELEPFPCGQDGTCPFDYYCEGLRNVCWEKVACDFAGMSCDHTGDRTRCGLIAASNGSGEYETYCVLDGAVGPGDPCRFDILAGSVDDCRNGLTCVRFGTAPHAGVCRQICDQSGAPGCSQSAVCADLLYAGYPNLVHAVGACTVPGCEPYTNTGCKTNANETCGAVAKLGTGELAYDCVAQGTAALGQPCDQNATFCALGLVCVGSSGAMACRQPCDSQNPCTSGTCSGAGEVKWCQ